MDDEKIGFIEVGYAKFPLYYVTWDSFNKSWKELKKIRNLPSMIYVNHFDEFYLLPLPHCDFNITYHSNRDKDVIINARAKDCQNMFW